MDHPELQSPHPPRRNKGSIVKIQQLRHHITLADSDVHPTADTHPESADLVKSIRRLSEAFYKDGNSCIRKIFRKIDSRSYGSITVEDFRGLLDDPELDSLELTAEEKDLVVSYCDSSDSPDGRIEYKEFFQTFYSHLVDAAKENKTTLKQVFFITRHGARFPLTPFPNNTAWPAAESFWKTYGGKLTPKGISQHLKLGKLAKEAYFEPLGYLGDDFRLPSKIHVYTSNTDRTFLSASSFMQGLCPKIPQSYAVANEEDMSRKDYQGIKIHIADTTRRSTPVVHGYLDNPAYDKLKSKCLNECPFFSQISTDPEYLAFLEKMWIMTSHKNIQPDQDIVSRFKKFSPLATQMEIERVLKMPLYANPEHLLLSPEDEQKAQVLADVSKRIKFTGNTPEEHRKLARAAAGLLPKTVCTFFNFRITKPENLDKKGIVLFSAHDYTIMAFLSQMGFTDWDIPNFAACLILELHKIDEQWKICIKYNPDPSIHKSLKGLRTFKMPINQERIKMSEAEEGMHSFEEFQDYLMNSRKSFKTESEWREDAGPSTGHVKDD